MNNSEIAKDFARVPNKIVYISGGITGTTDYEQRFEAAEKKITAWGYQVINPARLSEVVPQTFTHAQYMTVCLALLETADGVYMLSGFENSCGAVAELTAAIQARKPIRFEDTTLCGWAWEG